MTTENVSSKPDNTKLWGFLFAVYIIWGSTYLGMKIATEIVPPFLLSAFRFLTAGTLMALISRSSEKQLPSRKQTLSAAFVGLMLIGIGNSCTALAVHYMPSGRVALIVAAIPVWFIGFDWAFFSKQRPTVMTVTGIVVGLAGLFLLFNPFAASTGLSYPLWPIAILAGGCACWALGSLSVSKLLMPAPMQSAAIQMLTGAVFCFLVSAVAEPGAWNTLEHISTRTLSAYAYLVLIGSLVGFTSYSWLTRNAPPRLLSTYAYVNPVVALFLGWAIGHENLSSQALLACVIVIGGVVLMTLGKRKA
ncbi:EamA family transporter [Chitinophaga sp. CF418]|uniref:EamA family transporter n=1 Tax=Chitinophaga sp. CF418 TaxID=1855287 RepID=UPI00091EDEE8|nr:EamA family transporter [Chitinophaga sp. CF418]SHN18571.1 Permease of the drug/metabolite transporter (DMT) superfamily [Chitinophaga sp. CF418]